MKAVLVHAEVYVQPGVEDVANGVVLGKEAARGLEKGLQHAEQHVDRDVAAEVQAAQQGFQGHRVEGLNVLRSKAT